MKGLGVSNSQKKQLLKLSSELHEYDRRPLAFEARPYRGIKGRFGRSKRGPPSVDYMKRLLTHKHMCTAERTYMYVYTVNTCTYYGTCIMYDNQIYMYTV